MMLASAITGLKLLWHIPGARFAAGVCVLQLAISLIAPDGNLLEGTALCNYILGVLFITGVETGYGGDEAKAFVLVYTLALLLFTVVRGPHFAKLLSVGFEAMSGCENPGNDGVVACLAVPAITFRILVWSNGVQGGEYLAVLCRQVHCVCVIVFYAIFVRG